MRTQWGQSRCAIRSAIGTGLAVLLVVAGTVAASGCGGAAESAPAASANATSASPSHSTSAVPVAGRTTAAGVQLVSDEVIAVLEGRIAAMNRGDGEAAAAFYAPEGVLEETDITPHLITRGRVWLAERLWGLYDMGLRLAPAGAPIASGRYVAEPTRFYHGSLPGRGAAILVFEIDASGRFAYQWMIGWAGGPEETFALVRSPSVDKPNLPPRKVRRILDASLAALGRGDAHTAVADFAPRARLEVTDPGSGMLVRQRGDVEAGLQDLFDRGLRLEPASAPIAYDKYAAQPARFSSVAGEDVGAGMLVFEFDPAFRIAHLWLIGLAG